MPELRDARPASSSEIERVFRETVLFRFEKAEDAELLRRFGVLLFRFAVDSEDWGATHGLGVIAAQLVAAAEDVEHLVGYLNEVAETAVYAGVTPGEVAACRKAAEWAERLAGACEGLREAASLAPKATGEEP